MINMQLDIIDLKEHAQHFMKRHKINYKLAFPHSIAYEWWFFDCDNSGVLPPELSIVKLEDLPNWIRYGLPEEFREIGMKRKMGDEKMNKEIFEMREEIEQLDTKITELNEQKDEIEFNLINYKNRLQQLSTVMNFLMDEYSTKCEGQTTTLHVIQHNDQAIIWQTNAGSTKKTFGSLRTVSADEAKQIIKNFKLQEML